MTNFIFELTYLLCCIGFFISLKMLSSPKTARKGNLLAASVMALATAICLVEQPPENAFLLTTVILTASLFGFYGSKKVKMTAMPQLVAIFNGLGGLASVLVSLSESGGYFFDTAVSPSLLFITTAWMSLVIGGVTFSGSIIAFFKLQEVLFKKPLKGLWPRYAALFLGLTLLGLLLPITQTPDSFILFFLLFIAASALGIFLVAPIGGADMPVVISLLNSYSGVAAMAAGFVVNSYILIICGSLVGASGIILTRLMCQAMNRSLKNVIFGGFGQSISGNNSNEERPLKEIMPIDVALMLNNASKVMIVPGYGLAVSQAQRTIKEVADFLQQNNISVKYAIHPVAGRMPGHMNVLLAEADVDYEDLLDLDSSNAEFEDTDVALIIGANDVVNPSAINNKESPLFGMPILRAFLAKSIVVFKRGRGKGFAGVENPLFFEQNTSMVFGDAKASLVKVSQSLKDL